MRWLDALPFAAVFILKTLVYGALTVILGAAYAGLVLAGQGLFSSFAGGSDLAIAASTLVVATILIASCVAFVAVCLPIALVGSTGTGTAGIILGVTIGFAGAVPTAYFLIRNLWPMRDR